MGYTSSHPPGHFFQGSFFSGVYLCEPWIF
jgi:hypothetical protein